METPGLGGRLEREREFHDRWAAETDPASLDPESVAACPTITMSDCAPTSADNSPAASSEKPQHRSSRRASH